MNNQYAQDTAMAYMTGSPPPMQPAQASYDSPLPEMLAIGAVFALMAGAREAQAERDARAAHHYTYGVGAQMAEAREIRDEYRVKRGCRNQRRFCVDYCTCHLESE